MKIKYIDAMKIVKKKNRL